MDVFATAKAAGAFEKVDTRVLDARLKEKANVGGMWLFGQLYAYGRTCRDN
jgi:hypothetical protein